MSKCTIFEVADYFLYRESMPIKKLMCLCYYAYCWHLVISGGRQLFPNKLEAWIHGPTDYSLYEKFRDSLPDPIDKLEQRPYIDGEIEELLDDVYYSYGSLSGDELEKIVTSEYPFTKARKGLDIAEPSRNPIDDKDIIDFYTLRYLDD